MKSLILIKNINIIDVEKESVQENADIFIENSRIKAIDKNCNMNVSDAEAIDCTGKFAVPGLFECHAHMSHLSELEKNERESILREFVKKGITQVRDVGGPLNILKEMKEKIRKGGICGPDLFYAGPMLEKRPLRWGEINKSMPGFTVAVDTKEDAEKIIDELKQNGASLVKTFGKFTPDVFEYLVKKAGELKLPVTHDPGAPLFNMVPMDMAIDLGAKCIEHGKAPLPVVLRDEIKQEHDSLCSNNDHAPGADRELAMKVFSMGADSISEEKLGYLAEKMKERNVFFCPTLSVFNHAVRESSDQNNGIIQALDHISVFCTENMIKNGVRILVGIDDCEPGTLFEMGLLKKAGLSEMEIIKGATIYPARWLGVLDKYGSVSETKKANLLIVEENPLNDINNLSKSFITLKNGEIFR